MLGDPDVGVGLIELCDTFMQNNSWTANQITRTHIYLEFLAARSKGKVPTGARFMRNFVHAHPQYKQDSILSDEVMYDLCSMVTTLEDKKDAARKDLLGQFFEGEPDV